MRYVIFTIGLGIGLAVTYNRCITCVVCIAVLSALTMNCVPGMPLVFLLSCAVLFMHAIDYRHASVKVEVPLENFVYIPSWDDVHKYVHFSSSKDSTEAAAKSDAKAEAKAKESERPLPEKSSSFFENEVRL